MPVASKSLILRGWPWLAAGATGALLVLCFPPFSQGWLVWVALTPLLGAVWIPRIAAQGAGKSADAAPRRAGTLRPALLGYVAGLVFFAGVFHWLATLAPLFRSPWLVTLPLLLALYLALYFAFWAWFVASLPRWIGSAGGAPFGSSLRNLAIGALAACAWVAHEWVRSWLFYGFGWNGLGVALHRDLPMIQIADVTGVFGLTWLVAFCNVMAVIVVRRIFDELGPQFLKRVRWEFSFTMALLGIVFAYGVRALFRDPPRAPAAPLRVAAIQPNIPQEQKFDPEMEDAVFEQLAGLTLLAATREPDLIVWPEASTPRGMFADEANRDFVLGQVAQGDYDLLVGTLDYELDPDDPARVRQFNAAALLSDRGTVRHVYRKMHLVPFGEFLPMRAVMPQGVQDLIPGDIDRGREWTVLPLPDPPARLGVLICFEDTLGDLTRRFALNGAQVLVNLTNDGWFAQSPAAEQHLANAVFRAVENRRPLLRCANTGVTCLVDRTGRVDRKLLRPFEQGFAAFDIDLVAAPLTTYSRRGDWLAHIAAGITCAALAWRGTRWLRRRSHR